MYFHSLPADVERGEFLSPYFVNVICKCFFAAGEEGRRGKRRRRRRERRKIGVAHPDMAPASPCYPVQLVLIALDT